MSSLLVLSKEPEGVFRVVKLKLYNLQTGRFVTRCACNTRSLQRFRAEDRNARGGQQPTRCTAERCSNPR